MALSGHKPPLGKICGLKNALDAQAAADAGADFLGFIHYPKSPRHLSLIDAETLGPKLPGGPARVGVMVDADRDTIKSFAASLRLTHLQLHGQETPDTAKRLKDLFGLKIIKVIKVAEADDLKAAADFAPIIDYLLFDTKPLPSDALPGGNARSFPWDLLQGQHYPVPVLLAGGLTPENAHEALRISGADGLDVSSGVESSPGVKSHSRISDFLNAVKSRN